MGSFRGGDLLEGGRAGIAVLDGAGKGVYVVREMLEPGFGVRVEAPI
jgi:hypothetical protein